jgi:HEAT repeat protein
MKHEAIEPAAELLRSERLDDVARGVDMLGERLPSLGGEELRAAVEALCTLFFVDLYDHPDHKPALDRAVRAIAAAGAPVVDLLLEFLRGSDVKSNIFLARALGEIGVPALGPLRRFVETEPDQYCRAFGLYALGKVRDPAVIEALPEVIGAVSAADKEVRDSAARTLGKIVEHVPARLVPEEGHARVFDALFRLLPDPQPVVRAKCVRSLGKMVQHGYLRPDQEQRLARAISAILGDEDHEWDYAYIVRREAAIARSLLAQRAAASPS